MDISDCFEWNTCCILNSAISYPGFVILFLASNHCHICCVTWLQYPFSSKGKGSGEGQAKKGKKGGGNSSSSSDQSGNQKGAGRGRGKGRGGGAKKKDAYSAYNTPKPPTPKPDAE